MGIDGHESGGLARGVVGSVRVIAFGASNVAPAGSVVAGLVIVVSYAGFASPLVVLIAFVAAMCCASSIAEFARRLPSAGSLYTYGSCGLGRTGGFLTGWMMVFAYVLYVPAGIALTSAYTSQLLAGTFHVAVGARALFVIIVGAVAVVAYLGIKTSTSVDLVLVVGEVAVIAALAITILARVAPADYSAAVLSPSASPNGQFTDITSAMIYGITAFAGFEAATALGEEARNTRRSVPASTIGVVVVTGIFYLLVIHAEMFGVGRRSIPGFVRQGNPLGYLTGRYWSPSAVWVVELVVVLAGLGFVIATFNVAIRVLFAMGRERVLPGRLARLSRRRTPAVSIVCVAAFALALGLPLVYGYGGVRTFGYIAGAGGLAVVLVYLAVNIAAIRAFRTKFRDEFRLGRHLIVPAAAAVLFLFPLWGILHPRAHQLADLLHFTALGWLCLGVIVAVILRARRPSSFEMMGRVFMPAEGQPAYALEPTGDLAGGRSCGQEDDVPDGDGLARLPSRCHLSLAAIHLTAVAAEDNELGDYQGTFRSISDSGMRQPVDQSPGVGRPASKSGRPPTRPGTVRRRLLIERLAQADLPPIVSVVAPSGFGKTTLLSQWAGHDGPAFAWVPVEEADNDPKVLLSRIAQALDAVEPIGRPVFDALTSPGSSIAGSVVPRLGSALLSMTSPVALVLDDVHVLRNSEGRAALSMLADHVPRGSRLVLSGQVEPPLRIARLRAEGRVLEIGPGDLSLTGEEASSLLRKAGVVLTEQEVAELHRRTEGWPVGLYLAALYLREGAPFGRVAASFGGDDQFVSEYVESEFLSRISPQHRAFLTRTAVLERMCGPLCDAVLELSGSAEALADLVRSNLLLVPLDRRGKWYRYHNLFRDMLLAELDRLEPELIPVLRRRAAAWCMRNDLPEPALEYSIAAGDVETVADLVGRLVLPAYQQGRVTTVQRWFRWLQDRGGIGKHPMAAVLASIVSAVTGRPAEAERWADVVDYWQFGGATRPDDPPAEAWAALVRAALCRGGVKQMRADADEAVRRFAAEGIMAPIASLCQGLARVLSGDLDGGDASFQDAVIIATEADAPEGLAEALSERSLVAIARGEWNQAEGLAERAISTLRRAGIEDSYATTLVCAVAARAALHRGDMQAARQHLVSAQRTRSLLTYAFPHMAVQARIELIRVHLVLGDLAGARTLMQEVDELLRRRPGLGSLVGEARALRNRLAGERGSSAPGWSSLTAAELRLLPMLSTHLSFAEIAAEMFLSRHTISSQAMSIYRKLGVGSRSQAIARSRELGMLEG